MAKCIHVVLRLPVPIGAFLFRAKTVLVAVHGNARFPDATPQVSTLDQRIQTLEKAMLGSAAERRAARETVRDALAHLCDHVQLVAETASGTADISAVRALVESAAMDLRRPAARTKSVFAAKYGPAPSSVDLAAPHSPQRDTHDWEMSTDQHTWTPLPSTRQAKTRVTGLPVGIPHHFRHRLLTKDGHGEWSDLTVMLMVK